MTLCVVTGAGSGLGRALALALAGHGLQVVGFGRRPEALAETAVLAPPDRFVAYPLDVSDLAAVDAAFADLEARIGPVGILVNNAATYPHRDILDMSSADFMATLAINFGGALACTMAALRGMVATGEGRILNVGSFADLAPQPVSSEYAVSKGALRILTRALVADLADRFPDIVINDWIPGAMATSMGLATGTDPELAARWGAELALMRDPSLTGTVWERDREILRPRSLKRRIADRLLLRKGPPVRRLGQSPG